MDIDLSIKSWELDYRNPPYEDCTDGSFISGKQFQKGEILDCDIQGTHYSVKVVTSIPFEKHYKTYFDLI